jgi:hypothetical protein
MLLVALTAVMRGPQTVRWDPGAAVAHSGSKRHPSQR